MIELKTEKFSGPFSLLLALIEQEKMDITEINLAKIADDYVAHIKNSPAINPEELSDFLVVAAKLLYIKSKALLPYLLVNDEDEEERVDLEKQLKMYKEFVEASYKIKDIVLQENFSFVPPFNKARKQINKIASFAPPKSINAEVLQEKMQAIITRLKKEEEASLKEEKLSFRFNIEDKIEQIKNLIKNKIKVNFSQVLTQTKDKLEVIVSFLAILELAKQKELAFSQDDLFSEIHILNNKKQKEV